MNHTNNFTALRWFAAGLVLYGHSFVFLGLPEPLFLQWIPLGTLGVYVFFAISGFLVTQSWESDPHAFRFIYRRALRIFPGLWVCIALSIFPFGAWLTTLDLGAYLKHPVTWHYFSNVYLYITYHLPGVFEQARIPYAVNGSLWSLPAEFFMYMLLAFLGLLKAPRVISLILFIAFVLAILFWASKTSEMLVIYRTDFRQVVICGAYFLAGSVIFKYRLLRFVSPGNLLLLAVGWLCLSRWHDAFVLGSYLVLPFFVLALGTANTPVLARMSRHDYSYGIYIYAFPIQQAVVHLFPSIGLWAYLAFCSLLVIVCAALSWYLVEKPFLQFKPQRRLAVIDHRQEA
jgi:peptidoglycan/LPS O-acetylase OafA/YrhL